MQQAFASAFNLFPGTTAIKYSFLGLSRGWFLAGWLVGWFEVHQSSGLALFFFFEGKLSANLRAATKTFSL